MKFSRTDLISKIDEMLAQDLVDKEAHEKEVKRAQAQEVREWNATRAEHFKRLAEEILDRIATGKPVTNDVIPVEIVSRYDADEPKWFKSDVSERRRGVDRMALTRLKAILEASTDDVINTTSLREMGWRNIAQLFNGS